MIEDRELTQVLERPGVKTYELSADQEEDANFNKDVQRKTSHSQPGHLIIKLGIASRKNPNRPS